jgi:DNA gyrase/topoisomerase IV subunit B
MCTPVFCTHIINDYARRINELKEKDKNLDGNDIREGLTAIISIRIPEELLTESTALLASGVPNLDFVCPSN